MYAYARTLQKSVDGRPSGAGVDRGGIRVQVHPTAKMPSEFAQFEGFCCHTHCA